MDVVKHTVSPIEPVRYEEPEVPARLRSIINILEEYHRKLVHDYTSISQNPEPIHNGVAVLLQRRGNLLLNWLKMREILEEAKKDSELLAVIEKLGKEIDPWDPRISTLTQSYVNDLFFECPITLSVAHCRRLRESAKEYAMNTDGEQ